MLVVENTLKGSSCYLLFRKTSVMITKLIRKEFHAVKISLTIPGGLNIMRCVKYDCLSVKLLKKKTQIDKNTIFTNKSICLYMQFVVQTNQTVNFSINYFYQ